MSLVKDLDFENRSSWQGALTMLYSLCGESADLSFDCRMLGGRNLPTLEIRLDNPAELEEPSAVTEKETRVETWKYGTVVLSDKKPEDVPAGPVWLLRNTGGAAVTYRAFRETVRVLRELDLPAEFSWSSLPLVPICDNLQITARRELDSYACGAIHTLWLRCPEEDRLKRAMRAMGKCGQLRVQNMATANTWIIGKTDEAKLLEGLWGSSLSGNQEAE